VITTYPEPAAAAVAEASVRSADGTRIAFHRFGSGPAIVFVHGSVSTHTDWMPVARLLSSSFTCLVMDRRGRRKSSLGNAPYSVERECEDIAAVLAAAGSDAALAGHSYGAICALETALRVPVRRLVVYEPPLPVGGLIAGEYLAPYRDAIARGDLDAALEIGLPHFTRLPAATIAAMRKSRAWLRLRQLAPTWTRELEVMDSLSPSVDRYCSLDCPVMLIAGSESPAHPMQDAARTLAQSLPGIRSEILAGHGHGGMRTAPDLVASLISSFLSA
jgi:pimeloyl-ACP methyl ester carboxylesterase